MSVKWFKGHQTCHGDTEKTNKVIKMIWLYTPTATYGTALFKIKVMSVKWFKGYQTCHGDTEKN